jgi:hypothetical protein
MRVSKGPVCIISFGNNFKCTCCLYGAVRNYFDAINIHFDGHWKGWALKLRIFWALKWQRAKRVPFGQKKSRFQGPPVERLYYKRPILCLVSSKILTHWLSGEGGGGGVNILGDARHSSVLNICKYFVAHPFQLPE